MSYIGKNPKWNSGTYTPQSTQPVNPTEGQTYYDDGTNLAEGLYVYKNGNWTAVGSGSGAVNFYETGNADNASTSDFTTGNNASFDGGGTLQGTFDKSTTAADLISGTSVFKLTLNATPGNSDDDYVASTAIDIPQGYRGRELSVNFQYKYNGADNDVKWVILDDTNTNVLASDNLPAANRGNNVANDRKISFFCPSNCQQIKVGVQVNTHATGSEEFIWDDVIVNDFIEIASFTSRQTFLFNATGGDMTSVTGNTPLRWGSSLTSSGENLLDYDDANGRFTANRDGVQVVVSTSLSSTVNRTVSFNVSGTSYENVFMPANNSQGATATIEMNTDDYLEIEVNANISGGGTDQFLNITAQADSEAFINTATGTENEFTFQLSNGDTIDSDDQGIINTAVHNGTDSFVTITWNSGFFTEAPLVTPTLIGNVSSGVKAENVTSTGCVLRARTSGGATTDISVFTVGVSVRAKGLDYKNPSATAAVPASRVALVKDVKSSGTSGGNFVAGSYLQRTLNTLEGDTSFIKLASSEITLEAGEYLVFIKCPCFKGNTHKAQLFNVSDSAVEALGSSEVASSGDNTTTDSIIEHRMTLTESKTFQVRHRCGVTNIDGFGFPTSFGDDELYTMCRIEKLK